MAQTRPLPLRLTPDQYLEAELHAELRGELVDGYVYAMAGTTEAHNDIKLNLTLLLATRLPKGCRLFNGDVKLRIDLATDTRFYYPDIFVSCGPRDPTSHVRAEAILVVEVPSSSTERIDRGEKLTAYTAMPSLQEYVLVSQYGRHVEVFRRDTGWRQEIHAAEDSLQLDSIGHSLPVSEIYRDVPI